MIDPGSGLLNGIHFGDYPVLYVDDEELHLLVFRETFGEDFEVLCAPNGEDALRLLDEHPVAVLLVDQRMPGMTGVELCERVRKRHPSVQRLLVTAYSDHKTAIEAINRGGASRYLAKPWDADEVRQALREAIARVHLERRVRALTTALLDRERSATLAASRAHVLHDLGNMGYVVANATETLAALIEPLDDALSGEDFETAQAAIRKLQHAGSHIIQLQRKTAASSLLDTPSRGLHRVGQLVETAAELLRSDIAGVACLSIDCPPDLEVWADQTDVSRTLLNLLRNALQAFESTGQRKATIRISGRNDGDETVIDVIDNGPGIPDELVDRVLEPGFTTRRESGGSGLGLAICRELIAANDGRIELVPTDITAEGWEPGAHFVIRLPSKAPDETEPQKS